MGRQTDIQSPHLHLLPNYNHQLILTYLDCGGKQVHIKEPHAVAKSTVYAN